MCAPLCVKIPLTASSTTSTTRSICWTCNTKKQEKTLLILKNPRSHSQTEDGYRRPHRHTYADLHLNKVGVQIHTKAICIKTGDKQVQKATITLSCHRAGLRSKDFLNATECLCAERQKVCGRISYKR